MGKVITGRFGSKNNVALIEDETELLNLLSHGCRLSKNSSGRLDLFSQLPHNTLLRRVEGDLADKYGEHL